MKKKSDFVIIVDTREQNPYRFNNSISKKLDYGDYSIFCGGVDYSDKISIERKSSVSELYAAAGSERERWERELAGLLLIKHKWIICEFNFLDILKDAPQGIVSPAQVYGSICGWMVEYVVPFIFAGNRANARAVVYKIFQEFVKKEVLRK